MQVYTPADSFCVEPQTCPPDAFNLAPRVGGRVAITTPDAPVRIASTWTWTESPAAR